MEGKSLILWNEKINKASETSDENDVTTIRTCSEETDSISTSSITSDENSNDFSSYDEDIGTTGLEKASSTQTRAGEEMRKIEINLPEYEVTMVEEISILKKNEETQQCVHILGFDISHFSMKLQFIILALSLVSSTVIYGLLQELVTVTLASRKLSFFISLLQFGGSTVFSFMVSRFQPTKRRNTNGKNNIIRSNNNNIPMYIFASLSMLRAIDVSMSNLSMQYLNYPTKTLIKSSRVAFTVMTGQMFGKRYNITDYLVVCLIIIGLAIFLHADASSSVMFHPLGVAFLVLSLTCDGMVNNLSETIMNTYNVGQDEFLFQLYLFALMITTCAAYLSGDLRSGITEFLFQPGTYAEIMDDSNNINPTPYSYSVSSKFIILIIFTITGFIGSSSAAALTKNFGALVMSITGTARKSLTLFLSLLLYNNNICTMEHITGVIIFLSGLVVKSTMICQKQKKLHHQQHQQNNNKYMKNDLERI